MWTIFNSLKGQSVSDRCDKLSAQIYELNNRGCFERGQEFNVGPFTASISGNGWDSRITRNGEVLLERTPVVTVSGYVAYVECKLNTEKADWTTEWESAYKKTLAAHPKSIGYHALMAFRKLVNA